MVDEHANLRELNVQSQGVNLAKVRNFVVDVAKDCGFDENVIYDIKVAVGEAIANAMEHGSPLGEANHVKVVCRCDGDNLNIQITDEGVFKRAFPVAEEAVSYRGHGILLMLALMDKVTIDESAHGTTVSLTKNFRPDSQEATKTA
ncbi:MAG: ATP-binding protein [Actinomycetota bacterium]|nr:ATP-binding protein [Actinomycetota bacterium]